MRTLIWSLAGFVAASFWIGWVAEITIGDPVRAAKRETASLRKEIQTERTRNRALTVVIGEIIANAPYRVFRDRPTVVRPSTEFDL